MPASPKTDENVVVRNSLKRLSGTVSSRNSLALGATGNGWLDRRPFIDEADQMSLAKALVSC